MSDLGTDHCSQLRSTPHAGQLASCKLLRLCIVYQSKVGKRRGPRHAVREPCRAVYRGLEIPTAGFNQGLQLYLKYVACIKSCSSSVLVTGLCPVMVLSQPSESKTKTQDVRLLCLPCLGEILFLSSISNIYVEPG